MEHSKIQDLFVLLNENDIQYCLLNIEGGDGYELLVHPESYKLFEKLLKENGYGYKGTSTKEFGFIYGLKPDSFYAAPWGDTIHVARQMCCRSMSNLSKCKLPLDEHIQRSVWKNKRFDKEKSGWLVSGEDYVVYKLTDCIFNKRVFEEHDGAHITKHFNNANLDTLRAELESVFFRFTPDLMNLIKNKDYDKIIFKYRTFKNY